VLSAADGEQALRMFAEQPVDLVLLDYVMPGLNGGVVAQEIKRYSPEVPVVMVTACTVPQETLGCVNCRIEKGQSPTVLLEKVAQLLTAFSTHNLPTPSELNSHKTDSST
jgi:CheY-like chemotaxis protein